MNPLNTLFRENLTYNTAGCRLSDEAQVFLYGVFRRYLEEGYSPRDVSHIIQSLTGIIESEVILNWQLEERRKAEKLGEEGR